MCCTSTLWKCVWFENMGSITKGMRLEVENVTWRFCPFFFHLESPEGVSEESLPISTLSYWRTVSCSPYAFYALSHSLSKCWHAFCLAWGWQANDLTGPAFAIAQARPNGAKIMAPRWRHIRAKCFLAKKRNKTSQMTRPCFRILTAADLSQQDNFEQLFSFQGPEISECTLVLQWRRPLPFLAGNDAECMAKQLTLYKKGVAQDPFSNSASKLI